VVPSAVSDVPLAVRAIAEKIIPVFQVSRFVESQSVLPLGSCNAMVHDELIAASRDKTLEESASSVSFAFLNGDVFILPVYAVR
jgi:hypothetical protein